MANLGIFAVIIPYKVAARAKVCDSIDPLGRSGPGLMPRADISDHFADDLGEYFARVLDSVNYSAVISVVAIVREHKCAARDW